MSELSIRTKAGQFLARQKKALADSLAARKVADEAMVLADDKSQSKRHLVTIQPDGVQIYNMQTFDEAIKSARFILDVLTEVVP